MTWHYTGALCLCISVGASTMDRATKNGLTFKLATFRMCWRKHCIASCRVTAPCLCVVVRPIVWLWGEGRSVCVRLRVSLKPADAAELWLIRPSGRWQQVDSCVDFINLYHREDRWAKAFQSTLNNQTHPYATAAMIIVHPCCFAFVFLWPNWTTGE